MRMTSNHTVNPLLSPPLPGGAYLDKTRQDDALFGVLYSPMYIDFIQII